MIIHIILMLLKTNLISGWLLKGPSFDPISVRLCDVGLDQWAVM